ncbi:MAG: redoxin family protein [Campylobacter sp.]|nr:redoxin family protein [Campylobacter sp.]
MKFYIKILLVFISLTLAGCVKEYDKHHITLNDPNGVDTRFFPTERRLQIGDKPYALFFFGTDCGVCKAQIPDLNKLYKEYGDKIEFIGILGPSKGFDKDMALLKEHAVEFKTTSDKISVDYFSKAVGGVTGVPVVYFFDKSGKMSGKFIGLTPKNVLESAIRSVL